MAATSRAQEYCPAAGSPVQLTKTVFSIPSRLARSFILFTNSASLPLMRSAIATQESLAEAMQMLSMRASAGYSPPASKNTCEPPMPLASGLTGMRSSHASLPASASSKHKRSVMILHMLAMGRCLSASFSYTAVPLRQSHRYAALQAGESASSAAAPTAPQASTKQKTAEKNKSMTFFIEKLR